MYTWTEAFAYIVQCLKDTIAPRRGMAPDRTAYLNFLWLRLHRLNNRFQRLYLAWKAGSLPTPGAPRPGRTRASRPRPRITLPRGRLWLLKDTQRTAIGASLLRHWLATTPELQEFLQAVPKARIMLQPFCHGLGIDIDKPYGVPPDRPKPEPAANPPPEQPIAVECASHSTVAPHNPPLVFSSA